MSQSFVKNQSNINRSEKESTVKANFLSRDNRVMAQKSWMSHLVFLSPTSFLGFGPRVRRIIVKNGCWDSKIGQCVPKIFWTIYRNVRAYRTKGQLLYLCLYILKNKSIYKKNKEIGLGVKRMIQEVRKHVFFCPLVPSLIDFSILLHLMLNSLFSKTNIAPLGTIHKFLNLSFFSTRNEIRNLIFVDFGLPVFIKPNPEISIEVIS